MAPELRAVMIAIVIAIEIVIIIIIVMIIIIIIIVIIIKLEGQAKAAGFEGPLLPASIRLLVDNFSFVTSRYSVFKQYSIV